MHDIGTHVELGVLKPEVCDLVRNGTLEVLEAGNVEEVDPARVPDVAEIK